MSDVDRELKRLTRRGFLGMALAAGAGYAGWKWLRTRPREGGIEWPLRDALEWNESVAQSFFSRARLSPSFRPSDITR
ncbi:MAG TPA: molybdopterin-binding oxidoreductase, partial [Thermoanaerobaculia bacterium]|nr:molybdopterin-binding oxidoreductase [Thermoanaerobaculia bacterium]